VRRPGRPTPRPEKRPPPRVDEEVVFGYRAGLAVLARRPEDVRRVACSAALRREIDDVLRRSKVPRIERAELEDERLARLAGSAHHEGLCVVTSARRFASADDLGARLVAENGVALALDRVRNPYNIGAMLRSAAFFGVEGALLGALAPQPALPPDALRVAEGGAEHLMLSRTTDLAETLARLRARGIRVFGAESEGSESAIGHAFPRPAILVVGHEREGLGPRVLAQCDELVGIRGSGVVGSLNVAIAASVLLAEMCRARLC
jgi:TrmH RNA methyltransferase